MPFADPAGFDAVAEEMQQEQQQDQEQSTDKEASQQNFSSAPAVAGPELFPANISTLRQSLGLADDYGVDAVLDAFSQAGVTQSYQQVCFATLHATAASCS